MSSARPIADASSPTGIAPTPQNTPAAHQSHSVLSRPQIPSTLSEEVGEDQDDALETIRTPGARQQIAGLVNNPAFASMVESRLGALVGRSSGYIESLPPTIQRRILGLQGVQTAHSALEAEFQKEIFELEKRFSQKFKPLYERRRVLVEGKAEPTEDEIEKGFKDAQDSDSEDEDDEDDEEDKPIKSIPQVTSDELAAAPKGIPEFWLTALKNHVGLAELITERDETALKYLVDIRIGYPAEKPGFILSFDFSPEAKQFWKNETLEKTYYYQDEVGYEGDFVYDRAEGTKIQWLDGKDLTSRVETKKQRNKNTNQTRIVKKVVPTDSFFNFFSPPKPPAEEDNEDDIDEDIDEKLELDYQIGEDLKERVVPRAIDFFTGKALREQQDGEFDSDEFDDEDDSDEDDDDEDDDDDEEIVVGGGGKKPRKAPAPPSGNTPASHQDPQECKNQ